MIRRIFKQGGKIFVLLKRMKCTDHPSMHNTEAVLVLTDPPNSQIYCLKACLICYEVWNWHQLRRRRRSWPKLAAIGAAMAKKG